MIWHLHLILLFCSIYCKKIEPKGMFVLKVKFHLDTQSAKKIIWTTKNPNNLSERDILKKYLNGILEEVNKEIHKFNVQVIGEYSELIFEEVSGDKSKIKMCSEQMVAPRITRQMITELSYPKTNGLGLRLILVTCLVFPEKQVPFFTLGRFQCGKLVTLFVIDPFTVRYQIKYAVKYLITTNVMFLSTVKDYANKCARNNPFIGKFVNDLVNVKQHFYNDDILNE